MNQRKRISPHRQDSRRERQQGGQRREANAALRSLQEAAGNRALSEAFNGVIQRDVPTGTVTTSEGEQPIEGSVITSSAESIQDWLVAHEGEVNNQIAGWVDESIGDVRDGIQDAATSFQNWYAGRERRPNSAGFAVDVVNAALGIVGAAFPPAGVATAVIGGLLSASKDSISGALDPNQAPDAQVRAITQGFIRLSSTMDRRFANFGRHLKTQNANVWSDIALAIKNHLPDIARDTLHRQGGVPRPNQPYAQRILSAMIYAYLDWEQRYNLRQSHFFISSESVEYALFTEQVQARMRRQAAQESQRRLGDLDVQRAPADSAPFTLEEEHAARIQRERGGGQSLPKDVQRKMSAALGYDFSRVRVHADRQADALSKSLHARAFTTGRDIFFRAGAYQPASAEGQKLLAHELTHVVQQGRGEVPGRGKMSVNPPGDQYEQQAEANAQALAQGAPPQPGHSQAASPLQLQEEEEELIQAQDMFEEDEEMLM